jgi:FlaA1/EpsC-like NDP-sugar epimerase
VDRYRFLAGDVRGETPLRYAMARVDIVIHAEAAKHVEMVEVTSV